eukprot:105889-Karenia_brevis.AAC.1
MRGWVAMLGSMFVDKKWRDHRVWQVSHFLTGTGSQEGQGEAENAIGVTLIKGGCFLRSFNG